MQQVCVSHEQLWGHCNLTALRLYLTQKVRGHHTDQFFLKADWLLFSWFIWRTSTLWGKCLRAHQMLQISARLKTSISQMASVALPISRYHGDNTVLESIQSFSRMSCSDWSTLWRAGGYICRFLNYYIVKPHKVWLSWIGFISFKLFLPQLWLQN